jgi:hypothetical protein
MTGLDMAIAIPYTTLDAIRTASLQIKSLEYLDRTAMFYALGNFSVQLGIHTRAIDKERFPSSNLSMALALNKMIQGRAAGPMHIPENRTMIIQSLVVLDDQAKAAQMFTVSDVLEKMIQTFKQTSGFSTPRMEVTLLVNFLAAICKHSNH